MNEVLKIIVVPALLIVLDWLLRATPIDRLSFLIKPIFSVNLIEIAIIASAIVLLYKFAPKSYRRLKNKLRAKNFSRTGNSSKVFWSDTELREKTFNPSIGC